MQEYFYVRKNARYEQIKFSELLFVKAMRGYLQVVTESQVYFVLNTIEEVQKYLPKDLFSRTHRSYIVAIRIIRSFDLFKLYLKAPEGKEYVAGLARAKELPIGKSFRKNLRDHITILPNRMNKYTKKILSEAEFLAEYSMDEV